MTKFTKNTIFSERFSLYTVTFLDKYVMFFAKGVKNIFRIYVFHFNLKRIIFT